MIEKRVPWHNFFGFGGTLSGNPAAVAAIRATLEHLLTEESFDRMVPLAKKMEEGIAAVIKRHNLPWYVARIGCRVEFRFLPEPPKRGIDTFFDVEYNEVDLLTEGLSGPLELYIHLYCANRGILLSPVHNMALVSPQTTEEEVDHYVQVIGECVQDLLK